jgi:putative ABC transport system permease protein
MLALVAALMLASAAVTALLAGGHAVSGEAVRAVREDW